MATGLVVSGAAPPRGHREFFGGEHVVGFDTAAQIIGKAERSAVQRRVGGAHLELLGGQHVVRFVRV